MEERRNCSLGAIAPLFHNILSHVVRFPFKTGTRFSLRDKRLFETSEVDITRVDCISIYLLCFRKAYDEPNERIFYDLGLQKSEVVE